LTSFFNPSIHCFNRNRASLQNIPCRMEGRIANASKEESQKEKEVTSL